MGLAGLVHLPCIDVVPDLMHPDIEWVKPAYAVESGTRRGYEKSASAARSLLSICGDYSVSEVRFYDAADRVAVQARVATRSTGNAVPIDGDRGYVFDLRDGKIVACAWFSDLAEALQAVGLAE